MNNIPWITAKNIRELLSIEESIEKLTSSIVDNINHKNVCPLRTMIWRENPKAVFGTMPGYYERNNLYINKLASFVSHNNTYETSVHCVVIVFNASTGKPLALMDGIELTNLKCASVAGALTNHCASQASSCLGMIGAGVLAKQQVQAVLAVRSVTHIKLFNRSPERARQFRDFLKTLRKDIRVDMVASASDAVRDADIICTATTSFEPLFNGDIIKPTAHLNIMGAHTPFSREVPQELLENSFLIVEDKETAIKETGKIHSNANDVFQVFSMSSNDLQTIRTLFSSTGHIMIDMIITAEILSKAGYLE